MRRSDELGFPQGPNMRGYTSYFEIWICIEAGQLDRAAAAVADMVGLTERQGIDFWQLMGVDPARHLGAPCPH